MVSILSTIHGIVHILMACTLHGDTVMGMVDGMILSITEACILLGDMADGILLTTVAGEIHFTMEDTVDMEVTTVVAMATDMVVVFMTDTIQV